MVLCKQYSCLIFSFILLTVICAQTMPPSITYIRDIGDTIQFVCSIRNVPKYEVMWTKYDPVRENASYLAIDKVLMVEDSRLSIYQDQNNYTLQIRNINETDAGHYICELLLPQNNDVLTKVKLEVRTPPIILDNSTKSVSVLEGEVVKLECFADGYPSPRISWRKENNDFLPTGGMVYYGNVLKINHIRKKHKGNYFCIAQNDVGKSSRRKVAVKVEYMPVITVLRPRVSQALQYDMDLECRVEAYPTPAIVWLKDEIRLSNNQHYSISHIATADEFTDTTLRVITIEKRQYGQYTCKAMNRLGVDTARVELFESSVPVCPPACGPNL